MTTENTPKPRRWLQSAISAAARESAMLPFQRGQKRRPASLSLPGAKVPAARPNAIAAH